jgi:hypothetical protein
MAALFNRDFSIQCRALGSLAAASLIAGCALPDSAFQNYAEASRLQ